MGMVDGTNLYSGMGNGPVMYLDPLGLQDFPYWGLEGDTRHQVAKPDRDLSVILLDSTFKDSPLAKKHATHPYKIEVTSLKDAADKQEQIVKSNWQVHLSA